MSDGSLYEKAFAEGERAAWRDRRNGIVRERPGTIERWYSRAWWDGYTPRTSAWAVRTARRPVPQMEAA
jgi:hypothetical protein